MRIYSLNILFSQFWTTPVLTVASWPTYRFPRRLRKGDLVFPSLKVFHTKTFAWLMKQIFFFLEFICFLYDPTTNIGNLISGSNAFSKPTLYIWSSQFLNHWRLAWRILSITLLACEKSTIAQYFEHFFGTTFLWDWNENWPFPVLWPLLSFSSLLTYWVQHFDSIIF